MHAFARNRVDRHSFATAGVLLLRCVGCHYSILSDNLLNGTLPDSLTLLTRLKRLYAAFRSLLLGACKLTARRGALQGYNAQHVRGPDCDCSRVHSRVNRPRFLSADMPGRYTSAWARHASSWQLRLSGGKCRHAFIVSAAMSFGGDRCLSSRRSPAPQSSWTRGRQQAQWSQRRLLPSWHSISVGFPGSMVCGPTTGCGPTRL
jgi:hypothetical protein